VKGKAAEGNTDIPVCVFSWVSGEYPLDCRLELSLGSCGGELSWIERVQVLCPGHDSYHGSFLYDSRNGGGSRIP